METKARLVTEVEDQVSDPGEMAFQANPSAAWSSCVGGVTKQEPAASCKLHARAQIPLQAKPPTATLGASIPYSRLSLNFE